MLYIGLEYDQQNELKDYYKITEIKKIKQDEYDGLLEMISPTLKMAISDQLFLKILIKNKIISNILDRNEKETKLGNPDITKSIYETVKYFKRHSAFDQTP